MTIEDFNALPAPEVEERLAACLPVPRWVEAVRDGRPYAAWQDLEATASAAATHLDDEELEAALAAHPRIGERAASPHHNAAASAREQAGVDPADAEVARALTEGNAAYEARFDRVFLIRAAGRSAPEILAELDRRLGNDDGAERDETVTQLREIALLRLRQVAS
ncbi:2-oxo-4-hydroxy-4-carboxy-5-ureidoimidazoline decarboxylase [Phycicoccus badiiscoriae]|uniref:2-oxo-4-hydroxy-4-carboxy-5-ureidoimidazoline decarboxylase n=1 Tax=Pedococcus badiiscoriae TaxID=642776 RepID=A0A852WMH0_9MICO|nr:2-oxo-4-hydroxy-4-carboxy-5-ureidoimidazoline decarboxylase [Pedococcus badiiscoriae]NYG06626.1 2-oxo-4-hydroxy-4-carboxy-5-ureidoimidazoline decarboxylase [Pedococcus badiiscoriae]